MLLALPLPTHAQMPLSPASVRVPIVLYHHIRPITKDMKPLARGLSVSPATFEEQLEYLQENGYATVTLHDLFEAFKGRQTLPARPIILTFDDGYYDTYSYALPLLQQYGMKAVIFAVPRLLGTPGYLGWEEFDALHASGVFEIGAHSLTHGVLPQMTESHEKNEIVQSKKILENRLEQPVEFFAYPYGEYKQRTIEITKKAGYLGAVTTHYGTVHMEKNPFELTRVRLTNNDRGTALKRKMELFNSKKEMAAPNR